MCLGARASEDGHDRCYVVPGASAFSYILGCVSGQTEFRTNIDRQDAADHARPHPADDRSSQDVHLVHEVQIVVCTGDDHGVLNTKLSQGFQRQLDIWMCQAVEQNVIADGAQQGG